MTILLPKVKNGLQNVLRGMNGPKLLTLVESVSSKAVIIELPKFKMENSFNLNDALLKLGLSEAFSDNADFSKMTGTHMFVSRICYTYLDSFDSPIFQMLFFLKELK
uniref:Serpin domain-containing protein n=1 Tax=Romanomermis culicivorax TaxID=13658 RepID=A0A915KUI9_ROMCU